MTAMPQSLQQAFRANVEARMDALGLTQKELARKLKCTPGFVSQIICGHATAGFQTLEKFAKALQCEPSELLERRVLEKSA